jgi:putative addiction module killer protein
MIIEKTLLNYIAPNGKEPFEEWLKKIKDKVIRARIRRRLDKLSLGHYGDVKAIEGGIFELRLSFGAGYRIYFAEVEKIIIVLLCGGDKSTQVRDIKRAKEYWQELIERNKS